MTNYDICGVYAYKRNGFHLDLFLFRSRVEFLTHTVAISAAGLSNLAADPDNQWRVLESSNMLKMLLEALVLDHPLAQYHILRLLCGLVSNAATQAEVVSSGVVRAVQEMDHRDTHASAISIILFNISCNPSLAGRYAYLRRC